MQALGMLEVYSFTSAVCTADIAAKAADVRIIAFDRNRPIRTDVPAPNPRCGIGYFEPGHYCFVVVEGRGVNGSDGLDMVGFAELFRSLGCVGAYNLDGGGTAVMANAEGPISTLCSSDRGCGDMAYLAARPLGAEEDTYATPAP